MDNAREDIEILAELVEKETDQLKDAQYESEDNLREQIRNARVLIETMEIAVEEINY